VIIAATRGQHYLGDNGLGQVPTRLGHGRPTRPGTGTTAEYGPRGTEGHRLARHHLGVYTRMDPYGVRGSH
jgi:hypothetical protein